MQHRPVVVVLGAGMGGRGVAGALAGTAHLVIVDRSSEFAQRACDLVVADGGSAQAASVDLTDLAAVETFRDGLVDAHGRVDAVIHLVGGWAGAQTVDRESIDQWNRLLPGIVTTVQTTSVAFREALMAAPQGRYCMVTSTAVQHPTAGAAAYSSLKAASEAWVRSLGSAFEGSSARACILAVKALVDQAARDADPGKDYAGFTDTAELGAAVVSVLEASGPANGSYVDLTPR